MITQERTTVRHNRTTEFKSSDEAFRVALRETMSPGLKALLTTPERIAAHDSIMRLWTIGGGVTAKLSTIGRQAGWTIQTREIQDDQRGAWTRKECRQARRFVKELEAEGSWNVELRRADGDSGAPITSKLYPSKAWRDRAQVWLAQYVRTLAESENGLLVRADCPHLSLRESESKPNEEGALPPSVDDSQDGFSSAHIPEGFLEASARGAQPPPRSTAALQPCDECGVREGSYETRDCYGDWLCDECRDAARCVDVSSARA